MTILENLGPADEIIKTLMTYVDHFYHGRPGLVTRNPASVVGVQWEPVTHREENNEIVVYRISKVGKKSKRERAGIRNATNQIFEGGQLVGDYRPSGFLPEVVQWVYHQIARVWKLDNEFAARWASYAFKQDHHDLKMVLAAFLLVQSRKGEPVRDGDETLFDDDFRDVGEAMMLITPPSRGTDTTLTPKNILRIYRVLALPGIAAINRELGFALPSKQIVLGRWPTVVRKWLQFREENPKMLKGLVNGGYSETVRTLARIVHYKPLSPTFYELLRWEQDQAASGHRTIAIGERIKGAQSWSGLTEEQICVRIIQERPDAKRLVSLVPIITRAILAAAIEAGCYSDKDLIRIVPTLEEFGLIALPEIKTRLETAAKKATDLRAVNITKNVRTKAAKEILQTAADAGVRNAVEAVTKNIRLYVIIDKSGSMKDSIEEAKKFLELFLHALPLSQTHISVFDTVGREVILKGASKTAVEMAFRGISDGGGTSHAEGVRALQHHKPTDDEDVLFIFIGDEGEHGTFTAAVNASGLRPNAFGLIRLPGENLHAVTRTATELKIPCFLIEPATFGDVSAIPRTLRNLIANTPVGAGTLAALAKPRLTLVSQILAEPLLQRPSWA